MSKKIVMEEIYQDSNLSHLVSSSKLNKLANYEKKIKRYTWLHLQKKLKKTLAKKDILQQVIVQEYSKNKEKEKAYIKKKKIIDKLNSNRKNKNPILTVILLTYNHVETIEKCIQSLLEQDTKYDYIIKILDDASTDGTTDICFEYAQKYPEKIEYVLQQYNTSAKQFGQAIRALDTKYWCYIDGDDWWTATDKIEKAIDFLENNPEYVMYGTNTIIKKQNIEYKNVSHGENRSHIISLDNYIYIHPSSRIHRNIINYNKEFKNILLSDVYLFVTSLSKGNCYFQNTDSSVWNQTGNGMYTSYSKNQNVYRIYCYRANLDKIFSYKYHKQILKLAHNPKLHIFSKLFGKRLGWYFFLFCFKQKLLKEEYKNLKLSYRKLENRFGIKGII